MSLKYQRMLFLTVLVGLILSVTFIFLQKKDAIHQHSQNTTHQYISTLEKLDAKLEKDILMMDSWYFRNYDDLNAVYSEYLMLLKNPPTLPEELQRTIPVLYAFLEAKFESLERLKSTNALLRNSLNFLPKMVESLNYSIMNAEQTGLFSEKQAMEARSYLQQVMMQSLTNQLLDYKIQSHIDAPNVEVFPIELKMRWMNVMKHFKLLIGYQQTSVTLNEQLEHLGMQPKIEQLNQQFTQYLKKQDNQQKQQQLWRVIYILFAIVIVSVLALLLRHYRMQHRVHQNQALTDALTGLGNRRLLEQEMPPLLTRAHQVGASLGVLFIDLDGFKAVNDTLGHKQGDVLLQEIANNIKESLRQDDLVVRIGGDEFVVVISNANTEVLARIAEKMLGLCASELPHESGSIVVSASIGVSHYPSDARNVTELLEFADQAMYQAKVEGKACVRFYQR